MFPQVKWKTVAAHLCAWIFFSVLFYYYITQRLPHVPAAYRAGMTLSSFFAYAIIIYGYVYGLYPQYRLRKKQMPWLVFTTIALFIGTVVFRMLIENIWVRPLSNLSGTIYDWGRIHFAFTLTTCMFALLVAYLFTAVEDKIMIQKREEMLKRQRLEAELHLLKYQLQPHFLFNFLNNLYAQVYKPLPEVANQIRKGAELMRYYLYNSTQEVVRISSETEYLHNLIDLEKERLSEGLDVELDFQVEDDVMIPPMLFSPIIENLFKHGMRPEGEKRRASISLKASSSGIYFSVSNTFTPYVKKTRGTGLNNLRERLQLLYGSAFELITSQTHEMFTTTLTLPAYEAAVRNNRR